MTVLEYASSLTSSGKLSPISPHTTPPLPEDESPEVTSSSDAAGLKGADYEGDLHSEGKDCEDEREGKRSRLEDTCNCEELRHVTCHLETRDMWNKFHDLGTEMIITKTGR